MRIDGDMVGAIGPGLVVLLGVARTDTPSEADWLAAKIPSLRVFEGPGGSFDRSLSEVQGELLVVSQFTLHGQAVKGRRPDFTAAAPGPAAEALYDHFVAALRSAGLSVATGRFGAMMEVELVNSGPVTLMLERA